MEIDPDKAWSEKEQAYKSSGLFIRTTNITQTAKGLEGLWTTTVAIAMFLLIESAGWSPFTMKEAADFRYLPEQCVDWENAGIVVIPVAYDGPARG